MFFKLLLFEFYENDFNNAAGICEAISSPHMNFISVKTVSQQYLLPIHNDRAKHVENRAALANEPVHSEML